MVNVDIDDQKYEVLEVRAKEKCFDDTEEYIDHLLSQIVEKIGKEKSSVSDEEEEEVKKKLEELGYM
ncbi:MAG: hypothetical protein ABEJ83_01295 [Candidatus Nanohaloarchaea archaeon]